MNQSKNPIAPRSLAVTCLLIVLIWGLYEARAFFIPLIISSLLALMISPLARVMRKVGFPEWSAIAASAVILILPFLTLISVLAWQGEALVRDFPNILISINQLMTRFLHTPFGRRLHLGTEFDFLSAFKSLEGRAIEGVQFFISGMGAIVGAGSDLALVLFFSLLILGSRKHIRKSSERILDKTFGIENPGMLDEVIALVEKFLIARIVIVFIIGAVDTVILKAAGIQYPLLFGSLLGIMTLIPAIGFLIGLAPPVVVSLALGHSLVSTLVLVGALLIVSIIEGNVLTPKMVGGSLNINPLATFVGLFGGGLLWGIWGMFLSIPALGILRIIFSAVPSLQPWGELLADREDKGLKIRLSQKRKQVA